MKGLPGILLVPALLSVAGPASARDYPTRPIRVIGITGPGGTSDIFIRALGEELHKLWGQPLIVEHRPGANGMIGAKACAEAPADGYTLCILPGSGLNFNQLLYKKVPYDAERDFEPITNLMFSIQALVVNAELKVRSLDDLAMVAKAKPLAYMAQVVPLVLFMQEFNKQRGTDIVRVPFRSGGDTATAILSGAVPVAFLGISNFISHIRAGTMTALAVDSVNRSPALPDVPTLTELGYRDTLRSFWGLLAPARTPKAIILEVREEIARVVADPAFRDRQMIDRGLDPVVGTPEEFARFLRQDRAAAARVAKEAGIEPQ
jgi:tripartite-type tricarboxylate transporter receptor subunit TctC